LDVIHAHGTIDVTLRITSFVGIPMDGTVRSSMGLERNRKQSVRWTNLLIPTRISIYIKTRFQPSDSL